MSESNYPEFVFIAFCESEDLFNAYVNYMVNSELINSMFLSLYRFKFFDGRLFVELSNHSDVFDKNLQIGVKLTFDAFKAGILVK